MLWTLETLPQWRGSADTYKPFSDTSTITGNGNLLSVWDPAASKRFILMGYSVTAVVRTTLATGTSPLILAFWDDSTSNPFLDAKMSFSETEPESVWYTTGVVELREPRPSGAVDRVLKLGFNGNIGAGELHVVGAVWGREGA